MHVNDVVAAFILCLEAPAEKVFGETFNVGNSALNYQIKQLAQFVLDVIPNVRIHTIPDDADRRTYNVSFDKIEKMLGFKTRIQVHEGIVEIKQALEKGILNPDDPTCYTLQWYKSLIGWDQRIRELSYNNKII